MYFVISANASLSSFIILRILLHLLSVGLQVRGLQLDKRLFVFGAERYNCAVVPCFYILVAGLHHV